MGSSRTGHKLNFTLLKRYSKTELQSKGKVMPDKFEGWTHGNIANLMYFMGDDAAAQGHNEKALSIAEECGDLTFKAHTLTNIAIHYHEKKKPFQAAKRFEDALRVIRETGDRRYELWIIHTYAKLLQQIEQYDKARLLFQAALLFTAEVDDFQEECQIMDRYAQCLQILGRYPEAEQLFEKALTLATTIDDSYLLAQVFSNQADLFRAIGETEKASKAHHEARRNPLPLSGQHGICLLSKGILPARPEKFRLLNDKPTSCLNQSTWHFRAE
ncbi:tetratricopeptide repeat protein [candidate division CSSED10-310 bacterium]|uniref:Tetratricopeptide repeat protein n=1 Tax=candidate division CSSED10-310 bacterium TaxID=2855610 RepID=A0ABV6YUD1_UNCC1